MDQSASPAKALRWARGVRAKIATLKDYPKRCPVDPDSAAYGEAVRVLLYGKRQGTYRILFSIRVDAVHELTVRHAARRSIAEEMEQDEAEGERGLVD